jgi:hypothetical protein
MENAMKNLLRVRVGSLTIAGLFAAGCFIDNPNAIKPTNQQDASDVGVDAGVDVGVDAAAPTICDRYGGYGTAKKLVADLTVALGADCRINRYFTALSAERLAHLSDCLTKQVAVVMGCKGIRYDVDNLGNACLDMISSHKNLAIQEQDFDALIEDLVKVLSANKVAQADIELLAPRLLATKGDIVTNSAPGNNRSICTEAK